MKNFKRFQKELREEIENSITDQDVQFVVHALGIDPEKVCLKQLKMGLEVELEHADITNGDLVLTAKIALAHLKELPDYYTQLEKMEKKAKKK